jgi:hypothetical protein
MDEWMDGNKDSLGICIYVYGYHGRWEVGLYRRCLTDGYLGLGAGMGSLVNRAPYERPSSCANIPSVLYKRT